VDIGAKNIIAFTKQRFNESSGWNMIEGAYHHQNMVPKIAAGF
jgi:hypothetical protein